MNASKKRLVFACVVAIALAVIVAAWMMRERDAPPGRVTVQCAGLVTNSTGVYGSYVISNQSPYAIKVFYYFEGFSGYNVWNGSPIPKTIIERGRNTTILRPIISKVPRGLEFYVSYMPYTAKARLRDAATIVRLNKLLPAAWASGPWVKDEHCPLCTR